MPTRWVHMLLVLFSEAWYSRRDARIRFLKLQTELLRAHAPGALVTHRHRSLARIDQVAYGLFDH